MTFETLWPLLLLLAIPIIIFLYLLKPRGKDYLISSNLLWQKLLANQQSKTFIEKFVHNILMYLQILMIILLAIALMSPFISLKKQTNGRTILLIDTSASMQHISTNGSSRFDETMDNIRRYIRNAGGDKISIITNDSCGTNLLAIDSTNYTELGDLIQQIKVSDCGGDLNASGELIKQLCDQEEESTHLIVCTDAIGAANFNPADKCSEYEYWIAGDAGNNVSNDYVSFGIKENGKYDIIVSCTNYGLSDASFDVSIADEKGSIVSMVNMTLPSQQSDYCLFEDIELTGSACRSQISGITFADGKKDSLETDNTSYSILHKSSDTSAILIGQGNTFLEKAYQAIAGDAINKSETDYDQDDFIRIYDTSADVTEYKGNHLRFLSTEYKNEEIEHVVLSVSDCDLTVGLSDFTIGANKVYTYDVPNWAKSFLTYDDKCIGYYGEHDGIREIVVGFDIRETDFPLKPEFPIFLANTINFLSDSSLLSTNTYFAGEYLALQPWADVSDELFHLQLTQTGLFSIDLPDDTKEYYTVRFNTTTQSDSAFTFTADENATASVSQKTKELSVKQTIRNIFIILVLLVLIVEWIIYVKQTRYKGKFYLGMRIALTSLLILSLFGLKISAGSHATSTVFLVDLSNSNQSHMDEINQYLQENIRKMPSHNKYGIVTFGRNINVEQFIQDDAPFSGLMTLPDKSATNFEDALAKGISMLSGENTNNRIVLLTDGLQTKGDINNMTQTVQNNKVELLSIVYESTIGQDAYVENVDVPGYLHPMDAYSLTVQVESNFETNGVLEIYHGSDLSHTEKVHLQKGSNRFVIPQQVTDTDMENIHVKINAEGDTIEENNGFSTFSVVEAPPKILLLTDAASGIPQDYISIMNNINCDYQRRAASNAPQTIDEMLEFKCIIMTDVFLSNLPDGFVNNLEAYVKDYGCGFICCGGENSFALGGYRGTPVETVLPVDMTPKSENEKPNMAMVMIIDHSGSMSEQAPGSKATNLDVAIRSALVAADNLEDDDYVGVITFDDSYTWVVDIQKNTDRESIKNKISNIYEGGGTTIKPAVIEAANKLKNCDAPIKHIVLLTDGEGETRDFNDANKLINDNNITMSTVAIGEFADTRLMKQLANDCGGRYYEATITDDVPKIFAQEVFLGGEEFLKNGNFPLAVNTSHDITKGLFQEGWPNMLGYIATSHKPAALPIIVTEEKEEPILTVWQYGLGKTCAWNSDVFGKWSAGYSGQEDYATLWKRIIDFTTGNATLGEDTVNVYSQGDTTQIVYETDDYTGKTEIITNLVDPKGNTIEVPLHAVSPGKYEAQVDTSLTGLYHFNIRREDDHEITNYMTSATTVQYSDEYKFDISQAPFLTFMEKNGQLITPEDDIWTKSKEKGKEKLPITNYLLIAAAILFMFDIAFRRFQYVPKVPNKLVAFVQSTTQSIGEKMSEKKNKKTPTKDATPSTENSVEISQTTSPTIGTATEADKKADKQKKKTNKKAKNKEEELSLDTSALLKKKDDRNL